MKFGMRKPSLMKSISARTKGRAMRELKKALIPDYGKKGSGIYHDPAKALYNKAYNKATIGVQDLAKTSHKTTNNPVSNKKTQNSTLNNLSTTDRQLELEEKLKVAEARLERAHEREREADAKTLVAQERYNTLISEKAQSNLSEASMSAIKRDTTIERAKTRIINLQIEKTNAKTAQLRIETQIIELKRKLKS